MALNPGGKVPTLVHNGTAIFETSAICLYLSDLFPEAKLNIPMGHAQRGVFLQWMFYGPSCIEPVTIDQRFPRKPVTDIPPERLRGSLGWGDLDTVLKVLSDAVSRSPYIMGDHFTAADVVIGGGIHWAMFIKAFPELPEFKAYTERIISRPGWKKANQW